MKRIETKIFCNLLGNEEYVRRVLPFLKEEYFTNVEEKIIFNTIKNYIGKYNKNPSKDALYIVLQREEKLNEKIEKILQELNEEKENNLNWFVEETEKFCQEKAIYNALLESINIIDGKEKTKSKGYIPEMLKDALGVSFDQNIGHSFFDNFSERYDFYHKKEERIPFNIDILNEITKGGLPKKTLSAIMGGTGVGKSIFLCHFAASNLLDGYNVLYITLEMSEERIAERIDANLFDVELDQLMYIPKHVYESKINDLRVKTKGSLIVKEYPTSAADVSHFSHLLEELKLKKKFIPDIVYVDYINICSSFRAKNSSSINSYTKVKMIAEELRGLAVEKNIPIVTATQINREGIDKSDISMSNTSESIGLPFTLDLFLAMITSDELEKENKIMIKQLKNRFSDVSKKRNFLIGIERSKMKLYNLENPNENIIDLDDEEEGGFDDQKDFFKKRKKFG